MFQKIRLLVLMALFFAMAVPSAHAATAAPAARTYDCSKAGNANKTVCKNAAKPKPVAAARTYDCTKAGNASKAACKGMVKAPAPKAAPAPRSMTAAAPAHSPSVMARGPQGATARCRDNTYSKSATHKGACSHHGGVAQFY